MSNTAYKDEDNDVYVVTVPEHGKVFLPVSLFTRVTVLVFLCKWPTHMTLMTRG
jgi:hypothetical protein